MSGHLGIFKNSIQETDDSQQSDIPSWDIQSGVPPIQASCSQHWYYVRSGWHLQSDVRSVSHVPSLDEPPSWGIWWLIAVIYQVIWTFGYPLGQAGIQSDIPLQVQASGGQDWYNIRSGWYLQSYVSSASHVQLVCTQLICTHLNYRHLVTKRSAT